MFGFGKKKVDGPLAETRNWYSDRYEFVLVQRNLLFFVTIAALMGVAAAVYAVAELTDSKTVEPYIIEVEQRTGITTVVNQNSVDRYSRDDAVRRFFLWRYINAREGYSVADYEYNYGQLVRLMSGAEVYSAFYQYISGTAPDSPAALGRAAEKRVRMKSMTFLAPQKVQMRVAIDIVRSGQVAATMHRIITLDFVFADLTFTTEERLINPLGFQVVSYRVDEDAL